MRRVTTPNGRTAQLERSSLVSLQTMLALATSRPLLSLPQTGSYKVFLPTKRISVVMFVRIVEPGSMLSIHILLAPALLPHLPTHALLVNITQMVAPLVPRVLHARLIPIHTEVLLHFAHHVPTVLFLLRIRILAMRALRQ